MLVDLSSNLVTTSHLFAPNHTQQSMSPSIISQRQQPAMVDEATIIDLRRASARERKARSRAKQIKEFRAAKRRIWEREAAASIIDLRSNHNLSATMAAKDTPTSKGRNRRAFQYCIVDHGKECKEQAGKASIRLNSGSMLDAGCFGVHSLVCIVLDI